MRLKLFLILAMVLFLRGNYCGQKLKIDSLLRLLKKERIDSNKAKLLIKISRTYFFKGYVDSVEPYAREAYALSRKVKTLHIGASACNHLAQSKLQKGEIDSALFFLTRAKDIYLQIGDTNRVAGMFNNLGLVARDQTNYLLSVDYFSQALKIKEHYKDTTGIANAYLNLAETYKILKDTGNALLYNLKSVTIREAFTDKTELGSAYILLAKFYREIGNKTLQVSYLEKALRSAQQNGEFGVAAEALTELGNHNNEIGNYQIAEKYAGESLQLALKLRNDRLISAAWMSLASSALGQGKKGVALEHYLEALRLIQHTREHLVIEKMLKSLENIYASKGDYRSALLYHKLSDARKDSIFLASLKREAAVKRANYENEKRQLMQKKEQEKKDAISQSDKYRRNSLLVTAIIVLCLIFIFAYNLKKRFEIARDQTTIIQTQQDELLASIAYAKRIQDALLASDSYLRRVFPGHFVVYLPKDVVSGDFYWALQKGDYFYFAVCDCTGHGVPGAFLSLLNSYYLSEAIEERNLSDPGLILDYVREQLVKNLEGSRDGMDAVLFRVPVERGGGFHLQYSAGNGSLVLVRDRQVLKLKKDKMPVGKGVFDLPFTTYEVNVESGDCLYLFSDGYADQFGGPKGKKIKQRQLEELFREMGSEDMSSQAERLKNYFHHWKGELPQVDDVTVAGIRF